MRRFSGEFKARAVDPYDQGGIAYDQLADDPGVSRASLSAWIRQAETGGARPIDETESEELERLRKEDAILKEEREILKKAATFLAAESAPRRQPPISSAPRRTITEWPRFAVRSKSPVRAAVPM